MRKENIMKKFIFALLAVGLLCTISVIPTKAALVGFGHNTQVQGATGYAKSVCYSSGAAVSGAQSTVRNGSVYAQLTDRYNKIFSVSSTGIQSKFSIMDPVTTAGTIYDHKHASSYHYIY